MDESNDIIIYTGPEGATKVEVIYQDETLWITQRRMSMLFGVEVQTVNYHLKEIFESEELAVAATIRKIRIVQKEGGREVQREIDHYSLDAAIAVGYRVNSYQATRFRQWSTRVLKEFITKGFVLDDERLKQGRNWGKDYFEELLERIREIRASERRFYQKITDIFAQCSVDYDKHSPISQEFYATVQNKLHWAITGRTAAELVKERADCNQPHMGLRTWRNAPDGKVSKSDVAVAKNYYDEDELRHLNRVVSMYLDFAENQAERKQPMTMTDWAKRLDAFLEFNDYDILKNAGKVSAEVAAALAEAEFQKFRIVQDRAFESDFDRQIKKLEAREKGNE